jgi:hypothetical protein
MDTPINQRKSSQMLNAGPLEEMRWKKRSEYLRKPGKL